MNFSVLDYGKMSEYSISSGIDHHGVSARMLNGVSTDCCSMALKLLLLGLAIVRCHNINFTKIMIHLKEGKLLTTNIIIIVSFSD